MNGSKMIGRQKALDEVLRYLDQPAPLNLTLVGPALIGKTIFLRHVSQLIQQSRGWCVLYFDFAEQEIKSDQEFWQAYSDQLRKVLESAESESAEYLSSDSEHPSRDVRDCFDDLSEEGTKLLTVFDHFDKALQTDINQNTWSTLRFLASEYNNCVTWTASRMTIAEICFSEEVKDSRFPNVFFPSPVNIGCLENSDVDLWLKELEETQTIEASAKKEMENWTGGIPVLLEELCHRLSYEVGDDKTISKEIVDSTAFEACETSHNLKSIWRGCGQETRQDLYLLSQGPIPQSQIGGPRANELIRRGLALFEGKKLKASCRMMEHYSAEFGKDETDLERSFRDVESFDENIGKVLLLRLKSIRERHRELYKFVKICLSNLPEPLPVLMMARAIRKSALNVIWRSEFGEGKKIPEDVATHWSEKNGGRMLAYINRRELPGNETEQLLMLSWLVGGTPYARMAKGVTETTYKELEYIQELGNYANHIPEGEQPTVLRAVGLCVSALAVLENLTEELQ
ncbi:ATP-binding protein [Gammaproteobacteria bacterium]|nr:ATP-binding protein [Gammaproteobacteria bacterium]